VDNKIGVAGAKVIAEALKDNKMLTSLNLGIPISAFFRRK